MIIGDFYCSSYFLQIKRRTQNHQNFVFFFSPVGVFCYDVVIEPYSKLKYPMKFKTDIIALSSFSFFFGVNTDVQTSSSKNNLVNLHVYTLNQQNSVFFVLSVGVFSVDVVLGLYIKL